MEGKRGSNNILHFCFKEYGRAGAPHKILIPSVGRGINKKELEDCVTIVGDPIDRFATLRLWRILKEQLTISENETFNVVSWSLERPIADIDIKSSLIRVYDGDLSANFTAFIGRL